MSKQYKSTEFSAHLSRSKMRKYLNNTLSQHEQEEVELHLKHCIHCSNNIVAYVESEEPENYKAHMTKLKPILMSSVKVRKPKLNPHRIKVIRAAAAVVALFAFSFFALGTMVKKDFNLISDAEKKGNELPELKASQKQTQKSKANTSPLSEKKTSEVDMTMSDDYEEEENTLVPVADKKVQTNISRPKAVEQKQEAEIKASTPPVKAVEKPITTSSPTLADAAVEKKDNITKKVMEEKIAAIEDQEAEEDDTEVVKTVQPLQKIEKIDVAEKNDALPEAQNVPAIPNNGVSQLRQR